MAPAGGHHLVVFRFPVGISNACAMLQLIVRFDSSAPPAMGASIPRMGTDENRTGGGGGAAPAGNCQGKPKKKQPQIVRGFVFKDNLYPMEILVSGPFE